MQLGMRSTAKELEHPLWSHSGDGKSFKIESGVVLCERDMPGSSVPEGELLQLRGQGELLLLGKLKKLLSSLTAGKKHRINH